MSSPLSLSRRFLLANSRLRGERRQRMRRLVVETLESRRVLAAFQPGNLLILQADSSATATASAVTLIEIEPNGTVVQSIPVAATGPNALALRGNSTTEGSLNISVDGQMVTFGGVRLEAGSATSTNAVGVSRVIAKVAPSGIVDTSQAFLDGFEGDSFRSVATDTGSRFWLSGAGTGASGGVRLAASPTATTTTSLVAAGGNSRQIQILNGNIYVSSGSNVPGRSVFQFGSGLPTSGTPAFTNAIPIGPSGGAQYNSYYFADLSPGLGWNGSVFDTLYTVDTNGTAGAVDKWTFDGGNWNLSGTIAYANMVNVVGQTSGSSVTLFGTTKETNGRVVQITDTSGYNGSFSGAWSDLANPVQAIGTAAFRGITRVPEIAVTELSIAAADAVKLEGDAGTTAFSFTVTRSGPTAGTSSATWSVTGAGANPANGADFFGGVLPTGTVSFLAGETSQTITVLVQGDLVNEPNEGFTVGLSSPVDASLEVVAASGLINNDDAATELSIAVASAVKAEGNVGATSFTFTVQRSGNTLGVTSVAYGVLGSGLSPASPIDFDGDVYPSGTVNFISGQTSATVSIPVKGETLVEPDEAFVVSLSNPSAGAAIVGFTAEGQILNDDSTFAVSPAVLANAEGNSGATPAVFTVTRTGDLGVSSTVTWSTTASGSSSASADDFSGAAFPSGSITFLAGESSRSLTVNFQGDLVFETNETFALNLDSATVGTIATASATGVIVNDDFQALNAGDVVITAMLADNPDSFAFVPLVDLQPNASIVFTDNGWNGSSLLLNEGTVTYTAPSSGLAKGTKVAFEYDSTSGSITFLAGAGTASILGNFGLSTDGDSLLAYTGLATSPNFLFAVTTWGEYLTSGVPTSNQTYLPATLSIGSTAVEALGVVGPPAGEVDNAQYLHSLGTTGTPAQIRSLVTQRSNWSTFDLPTDLIDTTNFTVNTPSAAVVNRQLFYNRSTSLVFGDGSGNPVNAIDSSKVALLPGQTTGFVNYSNYVRGINGLVVDIANLVQATASDFVFATSNGVNPFVTSGAVATVSVLPGGGTAGSTRVKIEFPDNAVRNSWLRVTVLANANTGLPANDVFYFGNAVGDFNTGNLPGPPALVRTNATDTSAVRQNQSTTANSAPISSIYDINKDGRVNASDTSAVRANQNSSILTYFTAPASLQMSSFFATEGLPAFGMSGSVDEDREVAIDNSVPTGTTNPFGETSGQVTDLLFANYDRSFAGQVTHPQPEKQGETATATTLAETIDAYFGGR